MQRLPSYLMAWPLLWPLCALLVGQASAFPFVWFFWPLEQLSQGWVVLVGIVSVVLLVPIAGSCGVGRILIPWIVGFAGTLSTLLPSGALISGEHLLQAHVESVKHRDNGRTSLEIGINGTRAVCTSKGIWRHNLIDAISGSKILLRATFSPIHPGPNPFSFDNTLLRRGFQVRCEILQASPAISRHATVARMLKENWRDNLRGAGYDESTRALILASTLGFEEGLGTNLREDFKNAGLMHVLVVSGFQVSGFYFLLVGVLSCSGPRSERFLSLIRLVSLLACVLYVWLLEFELASSRALIALVLVFLRSRAERGSRPSDLLLSAAFLLSVLWPGSLFEPGPQLTFAALLGLTAAQPPLGRYSLLRAFWSSTLATGLASLVSAFWFRQISLIGFIANPVLGPIVGGFSCLLSFCCLLLAAVSQELSTYAAPYCNLFFEFEVKLVHALATFPGAAWHFDSRIEVAVLLSACALGLWVFRRAMRRRARASLVDSQSLFLPREQHRLAGPVHG